MKSANISTLLIAGNLFANADAWIGRPSASITRSGVARDKHVLPNVVHGRPLVSKNHDIDLLNGPMRVRGGSSLEMSSSQLVTTIVSRIGILTSTLLYFSPLTTVRNASNEGSLGDLNPIPLAIMAVSSICWLVYGLSVRDPYVTLSNVPGSIASIWYVTAILPLLKGKQLRSTQSLVVALSALTINLWTWLSLTNKPVAEVSSALGLFASALFIVLSGSPLSTIKKVVSTKNSGSILAPLTFAQVTNTALWSLYGLAIKDKFVWGPNLTGLGFGLIQLVLKILFPSK